MAHICWGSRKECWKTSLICKPLLPSHSWIGILNIQDTSTSIESINAFRCLQQPARHFMMLKTPEEVPISSSELWHEINIAPDSVLNIHVNINKPFDQHSQGQPYFTLISVFLPCEWHLVVIIESEGSAPTYSLHHPERCFCLISSCHS